MTILAIALLILALFLAVMFLGNNETFRGDRALEFRIRSALDSGEFWVSGAPLGTVVSNAFMGRTYEALRRWRKQPGILSMEEYGTDDDLRSAIMLNTRGYVRAQNMHQAFVTDVTEMLRRWEAESTPKPSRDPRNCWLCGRPGHEITTPGNDPTWMYACYYGDCEAVRWSWTSKSTEEQHSTPFAAEDAPIPSPPASPAAVQDLLCGCRQKCVDEVMKFQKLTGWKVTSASVGVAEKLHLAAELCILDEPDGRAARTIQV